jgi:hypothetical protein
VLSLRHEANASTAMNINILIFVPFQGFDR